MPRKSKISGRIGELIRFFGGMEKTVIKLKVHEVTLYRWAKKEKQGKPLPRIAMIFLEQYLGGTHAP